MKRTTEQNIWGKKERSHCDLVLLVQKHRSHWYIDSGCSKHMSGDKEKFITLSKHKAGKVTFGNDTPGKVKGKGVVSLSNGTHLEPKLEEWGTVIQHSMYHESYNELR